MCIKKISVFFLCVCSVAALSSLSDVRAHGEGASYEEDKDGYRIDVGYSPEIPQQNQTLRFDFLLFAKVENTYEHFDFSDVWVKITKDGVRYFAGPIHRSGFGDPSFQLYVAEPGTYEINVRYQSGTGRIVETTFPLAVQSVVDKEDDATKKLWLWWLGGCLGLLVSVSILLLIFRKMSAATE